MLRIQRRHLSATTCIAFTAGTFLFAAHIALDRFGPMLSSKNLADEIRRLEAQRRIAPDTQVMLFGDQAYGSSIPFYLNRQVTLVDGRSSSMLFGSTFADAPHVFLTIPEMQAQWGRGPRKILFIPIERRKDADAALGRHQVVIEDEGNKELITDRPLDGKP